TAWRASSTELITPSVGPGGPTRCESIEFQPLVGSAWPPVVAIDLPAAKIRGPLHQALVDRVAQMRRHLAAEVAHAGEPGAQGLAGVADRAQGVVDRIEPEPFGIALRARLAAQVHVQVGPAGQAAAAGQVDG